MIADTNNVYACYSLFIIFITSFLLTKIHSKFVSTIKAGIMVKNNLDYYRYTDNGFQFCKSYYSMIIKKKISKFGSANCINVLFCQKYLDILIDLMSIKKAFIAYIHLIMSNIKLKYSSFDFFALYYWILGYIIVLPHNLRPLFTILLLNTLASHNVIYIAWPSKQSHTSFDICFLADIQRIKVLKV